MKIHLHVHPERADPARLAALAIEARKALGPAPSLDISLVPCRLKVEGAPSARAIVEEARRQLDRPPVSVRVEESTDLRGLMGELRPLAHLLGEPVTLQFNGIRVLVSNDPIETVHRFYTACGFQPAAGRDAVWRYPRGLFGPQASYTACALAKLSGCSVSAQGHLGNFVATPASDARRFVTEAIDRMHA